MHYFRTLIAIILIGAAVLAGCGDDGSPLGQDIDTGAPPEEGPPVPLPNWSWLNPLPQGNSINGIAVSGTKAVAVGEGGVIAVGDAGSSNWHIVQSPSPGFTLTDVGFVSVDQVVAVGLDGTFISQDGGESWRAADDTPRHRDLDIRGTRVVAVGPRTVFSPDGISFQQGDNFDPVTMFAVSFLDDTTAVAVSSTRLFKTVNAGRDWEEIPASAGLTSMRRIAFATQEIGAIAADNPPRMFSTSDGGNTWTEVEQLDRDVREVAFFGTDLGLLMTYTREIYASGDAGKSWSLLSPGDGSREFRAAEFIDGSSYIAVGQNGVIERTDNRGQIWDELSTGHRRHFIDVAFPSSRSGVALAAENDDPFLFRSTDGGVTWTESPAPIDTPRKVVFFNSSLGAMLNLDGTVVKTTNGGASWRSTGAGPTNQGFAGLAFFDADTWVICGEGATVMRTTNGGDAWNVATFQSSGPTFYDVAVFPGTQAGVAVGFDGGARSENNGDTWIDLGIEAPTDVLAVTCPDSAVAVAVGRAIHRSEDRGKTWDVVFEPRDEELIRAVSFHGELHGLAVGQDGVVFETLDGGLTWEKLETVSGQLNAVAFRDRQSAVAAGSNGTLLLGTPLTE
jgi:photosystem II stability/assembly factor-like uncharacterized protein